MLKLLNVAATECTAPCVRRCSSSLLLQHAAAGAVSAVLLAGHMRDVVAFTRTEKNPADRASRDVKGWRLHSCALKVAKKLKAVPKLRRLASAAEARQQL